MADGDGDSSDRRDFLNMSIAGTAAALGVLSVYPVVRFLQPRAGGSAQSVEVGEAEKFPRGSAQKVMLGERPVLVLRMDDGSFRAFVALCTHLQCTVDYSVKTKQIECPCHRGTYSVEGENISGPPPRPLTALEVAVIDGVVTVREPAA
ncbi:MAG: Rieske 2Fe-2S domain-containing protein [Polyangiaceae bacterium]